MRCRFCEADTVEGASACARCGAELELPAGTVVSGRYEIRRFIGDGGMGTVYLAQDRDLDEAIAIKFLRNEFIRTPTLAKRFRSEIKLARRVSHRNVCKIFDFGQDGGRMYITMAYVDGVDLKKTLRQRGPLPPEEAFAIAADVAGALQAVHDESIVHRDLKTSNIMRDSRGVVRLMDFGVAKDQEGDATELTATGSLIGSPEYMSPEQWQGQRADVRSDVYALGIVVYELFTGQVPFRAQNIPDMMRRHILAAPPLEGDDAVLLPLALRPVLGRALAKEPSERFGSAKDMAKAMDGAHREWQPPIAGPRLAAAMPRPLAHAAALPIEKERYVPSVVREEETLPATAPTVVPVQGVGARHDAYATADVHPMRSRPSGEGSRREPTNFPQVESFIPRQSSERRLRVGARSFAVVTFVVLVVALAAFAVGQAVARAVIQITADGGTPATTQPPKGLGGTQPSAPRPLPGTLVRLSDTGVVAPVAEQIPSLRYPPVALRERVEGTVELNVLVDEKGDVADVQIVSETARGVGLGEAAMGNVRMRKYHPATKDGVPVRVWVPVLVVFRLP